jgi:hypothetical protein
VLNSIYACARNFPHIKIRQGVNHRKPEKHSTWQTKIRGNIVVKAIQVSQRRKIHYNSGARKKRGITLEPESRSSSQKRYNPLLTTQLKSQYRIKLFYLKVIALSL